MGVRKLYFVRRDVPTDEEFIVGSDDARDLATYIKDRFDASQCSTVKSSRAWDTLSKVPEMEEPLSANVTKRMMLVL